MAFRWSILTGGVLGAAVVGGLLAPRSFAGTATASAHSHDFAPVFNLTVNPTSSHPTFAYVDTGSVNTQGAHSRAWAAAAVSGGVLRKSTGGEGWYTNGASPKHFSWYASAGTGQYYITAPAGVVNVPFQVQIRASQDPQIIDFARPDVAPPEVGEYPSQGFFAENHFDVHFGIASASVLGPVGDLNVDGVTDQNDVDFVAGRVGQQGPGLIGDLNNDLQIDDFDVDIVVQNLGASGFVTTELLNGEARLGGPESGLPPLTTSGDLTDRFAFSQSPSPNPGQVRFSAVAPEPIISSIIALPVNMPFKLNLDQFMTYGRIDPGAPDGPPHVVPDGVVASVAGALVSEIVLPDVPGQQLFTIRAVMDAIQGDTNFDGVVDLVDLNNVRNNFGMSGPSVLGDTNGDGHVNLQDLNDVRNNFGDDGTPTPEPATLGLAALGLACASGAARARRANQSLRHRRRSSGR